MTSEYIAGLMFTGKPYKKKKLHLLPKNKPKKIGEPKPTKSKRLLIFERDGNQCLKCGSKENLTLDHITPLSLSGHKSKSSNLQTLCKKCNGEKGNKSCADYRKVKTIKK